MKRLDNILLANQIHNSGSLERNESSKLQYFPTQIGFSKFRRTSNYYYQKKQSIADSEKSYQLVEEEPAIKISLLKNLMNTRNELNVSAPVIQNKVTDKKSETRSSINLQTFHSGFSLRRLSSQSQLQKKRDFAKSHK